MIDDFEDYHFYKFRFTLPKDDDVNFSSPERNMYLHSYFFDPYDGVPYYATCGYETKNKFNEDTHPHLHMHIICKGKTIGAIRKALQRDFKGRGETRKGNVLYSLAEEEDVVDVNRFLRYVWKQGGRVTKEGGFPERYPPDMNLEMEIALAKEEQERMWEFNRKKQEQALKPSTKDMLFEHLDKIQQVNEMGCIPMTKR